MREKKVALLSALHYFTATFEEIKLKRTEAFNKGHVGCFVVNSEFELKISGLNSELTSPFSLFNSLFSVSLLTDFVKDSYVRIRWVDITLGILIG